MYSTDYAGMIRQLTALTAGVPYKIANMANASALLWQSLPDINWVGFYIREDSALILGPFQGKPACIVIPEGKGVCGAALQQDKTQLVADVHQFPGHIACDSASQSEIVIPIHRNGQVWGVLDIDSPLPGRFTESDRAGLEEAAAVLEAVLA